jgi:hypothetical protein
MNNPLSFGGLKVLGRKNQLTSGGFGKTRKT